MNRSATTALCFSALLYLSPSITFAQNAPPTYEADPSVYKILFEDQSFRVISATWKVGATDKAHSHTAPSVGYFVTDCTLRLRSADGKTVEINPKAGGSMAIANTPSHTAENAGSKECQAVLVERK
jgi:hypothetical protein